MWRSGGMRRSGGAALVIGVGLLSPFAAAAQGELRLERVLLSTGGVGYFEYEAVVDGDARLALDIRLDRVDDVLKSLVVFDDAGGIGAVRLPGREPLAELFRDLPFAEQDLDSPAALLAALRGAEVEIGGPRTTRGRVLAVVPETTRHEGDGFVTRHRLSVMTADGLRQVLLEDAESVRFADPALASRVAGALEAIARHGERERRRLEIESKGEGTRVVRVGHVVEAPLWKSAYRIVLPDALGEPGDEAGDEIGEGLVQGFAILENLSGEDWHDVELTVVSGQPVTFRQALYEAYFVERPEVPVEVVGRILPPVDPGDRPLPALARPEAAMRMQSLGMVAGEAVAEDMMPPPPMSVPSRPAEIDAADAAEATTQVVFRVPHPVSVVSGESLMVPIIAGSLPMARVSWYRADADSRHPEAALRLENDRDSGLPPGILTIYEPSGPGGGIAHVGDARLGALPAGEERLIAYARDERMSVDRERSRDETLESARLIDGVLEIGVRERRTTHYDIQAPARDSRRLVLEHPITEGFELVRPDPAEVRTTGSRHRIEIALDAGETRRVVIVEERPVSERVELDTIRDDDLASLVQAVELTPELREALAGLAERRADLAERERNVRRLETLVADLLEDQGRLRENLRVVPAQSDLERRYLGDLAAREDDLARLRAEIVQARDAEASARDEFRAYLRALDL